MDHKTTNLQKRARDARVVRTQAALRDALVALLDRHEFAAITAQMIVAEAGVGYATFFRHHSGVEALLLDMADTMLADAITALLPAVMGGDRATMLRTLTGFVGERRGAVRALLIGGGETVRREIVAKAIERTAGLPLAFDPAVPRELAIRHAVGTSMTVLGWWVSVDVSGDEDAVAALIERLALQPLRVDCVRDERMSDVGKR